jgi:hypothetical protein
MDALLRSPRTDEAAPDAAQRRLAALIRASPVLMRALRTARELDPPDWLVGGEALRDRLWDRMQGVRGRVRHSDVELVFFDPLRLDGGRERGVQRELGRAAPDIDWEVTNHAAVHLWYPRVFGRNVAPLACASAGVARSTETATAIGVRLLADDSLHVVAPHGLEDLFGLVCRRNPQGITREQFHRRLQTQQVARRWPGVRIVDGPEQGS